MAPPGEANSNLLRLEAKCSQCIAVQVADVQCVLMFCRLDCTDARPCTIVSTVITTERCHTE